MQSFDTATVNRRAGPRPAATLALALIAAFVVPGAANALDRHLRVVNDSHHDIVSFFATKVGLHDPEDNLLGTDVLPAGKSVVLDFEDGSGYCRFRLRAVFDDGVALERASVNICEVGTYRYTD